ncbi:unnamed protein product [Clonostachys chloroleuca]|uniref:Citrate transporter-like domain-containing protein n=1 Tax=Clonostachys chloroleuca TaxID=1926264 RepID=A0AA35PU93_9HYPO|nr:unnamed protein product [Clonostachys chloroleuca]
MAEDLDTSKITHWRSIVTLIVFVLTNINVLFPFHIPILVPKSIYYACLDCLSSLRIIPRRYESPADGGKAYVRLRFPMNLITAPLIADLFLLAILAIGRKEVHDGTIGTANISPLDIMIFFITLAYIAISIDASGLIRYLALKVLQRAGKAGHRLFFFLYAFFFLLSGCVGNDPIILSGTPFLAYMTRASSNIANPRAWIFTQFSMANIASAILVSSNPTNLVLAGAFEIKFINYTANMIVPVVITAITLFPFLLYVVFRGEGLIPKTIDIHELPLEEREKKPVNPNIPNSRVSSGEGDVLEEKILPLAEIMNPFLDKPGAIFGSLLMAVTLITLLTINAVMGGHGQLHVFWITLPAAVVMLCWDLAFGWFKREETRKIARNGQNHLEMLSGDGDIESSTNTRAISPQVTTTTGHEISEAATTQRTNPEIQQHADNEKPPPVQHSHEDPKNTLSAKEPRNSSTSTCQVNSSDHATLVSLIRDSWAWLRETFPNATTVLMLLPLPLVPFAFAMFVLVQALVTKGWVPVFAYGWDHWVEKTGTVGAIGGMGFLSVILCNFAGTNIGTTILLSRVIQAWQEIHRQNGVAISDRTFWATVYGMALGVNYGAFSTAFSASLAGLLWRDILMKKHIKVGNLEFARINIPIIAFTMVVGSAVLIGQIYITRKTTPYSL